MATKTWDEASSARTWLLRVIGRSQLREQWPRAALLLALLGACALHAYDLGHTLIAPWDESIHAVVAEHLATHPLMPTLYETFALPPADLTNWSLLHIWLHIPPFGLWMAALSMRLFGVTPLALRLPSLVFALAGMLVVYLLGRRLYGPVAAIVAAVFVGFAPFPLLMSQGYVFGDVTDAPLFTLTPLAVYGLVRGCQSGRRRWLVLGGISLGLCYLDKSALGLAPAGVAVGLYLADRMFAPEQGWRPLGLRGLAIFFGAAVVVALPYNLYIAHAYPADVARESQNWLKAFFTDYEGWGMAVDGHLTNWLYRLYGAALALFLVSSIVALVVVGMRKRARADLVPVLWILTLYVPLTLAITKSPPMTIGAFPAFGLALGRMLTLGLGSGSPRIRAAVVGLLLGAAGTALIILSGHLAQADTSYAVIRQTTPDVSRSLYLRFRPYAIELGLSAVAAAGFFALDRLLGERARLPHGVGRAGATGSGRLAQQVALVCVVGLAAVVLGGYWLHYDAQAVSARPRSSDSPVPALGAYLQEHLASNATVLIPADSGLVRAGYLDKDLGRLQLMFWAHRDVYSVSALDAGTVCPLVAQASNAHSPVAVFTDQPFSGDELGSVEGWTLYAPRCG